MPDVLARATTLIDLLGQRPGEPLAVRDVAAATGLPPATCTRLLKALVALGWVDQDGNRGDYRLGPRAYALTATGPYRARLLAAAVPVMRELATRWPRAGVVLIVLRPWQRQMLWECSPASGRDGRLRLAEESVWNGASGRLLLALLPARERSRWIDRLGLPSPAQWKGIATRRELEAALAEIRRERRSEVLLPERGIRAVSTPVPDGEGGTAALGAYLPTASPIDPLWADLRTAAARIRP